MRKKFILLLALPLFLSFGIISSLQAGSERVIDKALCADLIRHGKEAYMRGKYLDAKEYFRKATVADPENRKAWKYYDQTVIFALAEKVEKNSGLLMPDVSTRKEGDSILTPLAEGVLSKVGDKIDQVKKNLNLESEDQQSDVPVPAFIPEEEEEEEEEGC